MAAGVHEKLYLWPSADKRTNAALSLMIGLGF